MPQPPEILCEADVPLRVRYRECDPMNVAHHSVYPVWLEIARTELLRRQGHNYRDLEAAGVFLVVARLSVRYRRPARYDDELVVRVCAHATAGVKLEHSYEIRRDAELLCTAQTTLACVDGQGRCGRRRPRCSGRVRSGLHPKRRGDLADDQRSSLSAAPFGFWGAFSACLSVWFGRGVQMNAGDPVHWFMALAAVSAAAWWGGVRLGRGPAWHAWGGTALGIGLILGWAWLVRRPAVAIEVIPVGVLSRIEGVGGVPLFMAILGVAWSRCRLPRQRQAVAWAVLLGAVYFVNGGFWLLQTTPSAVMGQSVADENFRQSQDYSCVPAACATALNLLGFESTEAEMAELTMTRAGTGATMIRALDGLDQKLRGTGLKPVLFEPGWDVLLGLQTPALTPLQFEPAQRHMVVLTRIGPHGVWVLDPNDGNIFYPPHIFLELYRDQVIVFERR